MPFKKINSLAVAVAGQGTAGNFPTFGEQEKQDDKPEKKEGHWSFAHDDRQVVGPYDYKPVNEYYKQMLKKIAEYIENEEDFFADNGMEGSDPNVFKEIENILAKIEEQKYLLKSFNSLAENLESTSAKFQRNLAELHKYCSLDEKEYVEAKETFEDQISSLQVQTSNTVMLISAIGLQFESMNKMIQSYKDKEGILGES